MAGGGGHARCGRRDAHMCLEVSKYRIGWSGIRDAKTGKQDRIVGLSLAEMAGAKVWGRGLN